MSPCSVSLQYDLWILILRICQNCEIHKIKSHEKLCWFTVYSISQSTKNRLWQHSAMCFSPFIPQFFFNKKRATTRVQRNTETPHSDYDNTLLDAPIDK